MVAITNNLKPKEKPLLQDKTFSSIGTYTPDNGYDAFRMVTIKIDGVNNFSTEDNLLTASYALHYSNSKITVTREKAFYFFTPLLTLELPNCKTVGFDSFGYCSKLSSVNLPLCSSIGSWAFVGCRSLSSVSFPVCKNISEAAFQYCYSL